MRSIAVGSRACGHRQRPTIPDLPIRGRYLSVRVRVDADRVYAGSELPKGNVANFWSDQREVTLGADGGHLVAYLLLPRLAFA